MKNHIAISKKFLTTTLLLFQLAFLSFPVLVTAQAASEVPAASLTAPVSSDEDIVKGLQIPSKKADYSIPQPCVVDPFSAFPSSTACKQDPSSSFDSLDSKFKQLYLALANRKIIGIINEPISNENLFHQATVCSTKYLRDRNGYLQFTDKKSLDIINSAANQDKQKAVQELYQKTDLKVAFTVDSCTKHYVASCTPQNRANREVELSEPLPAIVNCEVVQILFADSGIDLLKQYINFIYRTAVALIGVVAVLVIVINGIIISMAGSDESVVSAAKGRILQSLSALVILFLAGIILYTINPNYFTITDLQSNTSAAPEESPQSTSK